MDYNRRLVEHHAKTTRQVPLVALVRKSHADA